MKGGDTDEWSTRRTHPARLALVSFCVLWLCVAWSVHAVIVTHSLHLLKKFSQSDRLVGNTLSASGGMNTWCGHLCILCHHANVRTCLHNQEANFNVLWIHHNLTPKTTGSCFSWLFHFVVGMFVHVRGLLLWQQISGGVGEMCERTDIGVELGLLHVCCANCFAFRESGQWLQVRIRGICNAVGVYNRIWHGKDKWYNQKKPHYHV